MSPNEVPIAITFKLDQVNLILNSLAKLPYEQVEQLITDIRSAAIASLKDAESQALAAIDSN